MNCDTYLNCFMKVASNYRVVLVNESERCLVGVKPGIAIFVMNFLQSGASTYMLMKPKQIFEYEITPLNGEIKRDRFTCRTVIGLAFTLGQLLFNVMYNALYNFNYPSYLKSQEEWSVNWVKHDLFYCDGSIKDIQESGNVSLGYMTQHVFENIRDIPVVSILFTLIFSVTSLASIILCTQRGVLTTNKLLFGTLFIISLATIGLNLATAITSAKCQINGQNILTEWSNQCFNTSKALN